MRAKRFYLAATMALSAFFGQAKAQTLAVSTQPNSIESSAQYKAPQTKINTKHKVVREVGGMPLVGGYNPGMTPKQYGQIYGNGGSKKSNKNRYAHNAKVKRRKSAAC